MRGVGQRPLKTLLTPGTRLYIDASGPQHAAILLAVADIVIRLRIELRVRHIAGKANTAADLLSRLLIDDFKLAFPWARVQSFQPPIELLSARWAKLF